jgi:uncharacterized phage protein (predicted DNA packaging)
MKVTLKDIKQHLNLDEGFTEDDYYLMQLIDVAEMAVERHLNKKLSTIKSDFDNRMIIHAIKIIAANLYQNRESVGTGNYNKIPYTLEYLINLQRNFGDRHGIKDEYDDD